MFEIIYCDKSTVPVIDVRNAVNFRTTLFNLRSLSDKIVAFKFVSKLHLQLPRFSSLQFIILTFLLGNSEVEISCSEHNIREKLLYDHSLDLKTYFYHLFGYVYGHCKNRTRFADTKKSVQNSLKLYKIAAAVCARLISVRFVIVAGSNTLDRERSGV